MNGKPTHYRKEWLAMPRESTDAELFNELKIDKDCFVDKQWIKEYIQLITSVCKKFLVWRSWIFSCFSEKKGLHFYIKINQRIKNELANRLQWLLGDDCRRVDFNRARIRSGLNEWNKLFELPNRRLRTIYRKQSNDLKRTKTFGIDKDTSMHYGVHQ